MIFFVGGCGGLVVGVGWGALREGLHFSQSKNVLLLNLYYDRIVDRLMVI